MKAASQAHKKSFHATRKTPTTPVTIADWMKVFHKLYGKVDAERSPVEMWVAATAHFTKIGEAIRRMHFAELMKAATHAFCWMCSFVLACQRAKETVFSLEESFSAIVACKYPLVCGHCKEAYCHCNPELMDRMSDKAAKYQDLFKLRSRLSGAPDTYGVSDWLEVFNNMYGQNIHNLTLESIGFHFIEEAGEELTAIRGLKQLEHAPSHIKEIDTAFLKELATVEGILRLYRKYIDEKPESYKRDPESIKNRLVRAKVDMFVEFADTFSWFCSILNKVNSIALNCKDDKCSFTQHPFREKLLQEYLPEGSPRCPSCDECPCKCVFYNRPPKSPSKR